MTLEPVYRSTDTATRRSQYTEVTNRIVAAIEGESDWIAVLATAVCELHHAFTYFHWTGFYRVTEPCLLKVGPYQGGHGCTTIQFKQGICGAAARERKTQLVPDVHARPEHIACSSTTNSEIVVPLLNPRGGLLAVLDIDSDLFGAFDEEDRIHLELLCDILGAHPAAPDAQWSHRRCD